MDKEKIIQHLDSALDKQAPDSWDKMASKIQEMEQQGKRSKVLLFSPNAEKRKSPLFKKLSIAAAVCIIAASALTFTPVLASIQEMYDKIFSSKHIDDTGLKVALNQGHNQGVNQTFYDKEHDINVHFESVLTDDKETKLLLTYQSKKTNLEKYYVDIFEGKSSVNLIVGNTKKKLDCVGWGSRYYDKKENKVAEALSFESIKEYKGQNIRLEINNLTVYEKNKAKEVQAVWPLEFKLDDSAVSERKTVELNKKFEYKNIEYTIKRVEYSGLETRVVVTGDDTKVMTDESGMKYEIMSKLEHQFLNARKVDKKYGYIVDENKSGIFIKSAGEKVEPIFSKGEVKGEDDEYLMIFAPVKDNQDCILEVGDDIKVPLSK